MGFQVVNQSVIQNYLQLYGDNFDAKRVKSFAEAFDAETMIVEYTIYPEDKDRPFQFVKRTSLTSPFIKTGNWFFRSSAASMDDLAIHSGLAGRNLTEFKVNYPVTVLEGVASKLNRNWDFEYGGSGGGVQIFMAQKFLFSLEVVGTHLL
ncbi:MAG: hypothetical protein C4308_10150 [Chitinophagaceae bacterium]